MQVNHPTAQAGGFQRENLMNSKAKTALTVVGLAAFFNFTSLGQAVAVTCYGDAAMIYSKIISSYVPFLSQLTGDTGAQEEEAIKQSGAAVRADVAKAGMATNATEEGLATYRLEQELRERTAKTAAALQQAPLTCQSLAVSDAVGGATRTKDALAFKSQGGALSRLRSNGNTVAAIDQSFEDGNRFCSAEDQALGICKSPASSTHAKFEGADRDAAFLFQGVDGSATHDGGSVQDEATQAYVNRIIGTAPPEQLRSKGDKLYKGSPQARAYVELLRRYNAMMSMGAYSLKQTAAMHTPQPGLGTATMMDTIPAPGFAAGKADMSWSEVLERYIASKFSPTTIQGLATATEPGPILRDMAQVSAFQLWLSYQNMEQGARIEALEAHRLALAADAVLRPQIAAQRMSVASSGQN